MSNQLRLSFRSSREMPPRVLVRLNETDLRYLARALDEEKEFLPSFLKETRSQRLGCTVRDLESMFNFELARHLADEACIMRQPGWAVIPPAYIDWKSINQRAQQTAIQLAEDFAAFRASRRK